MPQAKTKFLGKMIDGTSVTITRKVEVLENGEHRSTFSFDIDGMMVDQSVDLPEQKLGYRHFLEMGALASMGFASVSPVA